MSKNPRVAVCGATGAVGREMLKVLEQREFPASEVVPFASARSKGKKLPFRGGELTVQELTHDCFEGFDVALFSAGGSTSETYAPSAAKLGCTVVDNSSAWRMNPECPLVVPEVNPHDLKWHKGIIANPNCSTIQMVVALQPIHLEARIKRVVVSTYQAVSGSGQKAINELETQVRRLFNGQEVVPEAYPHQIAFNCLPQIDVFLEDGYTKEEMKMVNETIKIMGDPNIKVTATTVRVPVFYGHSESVNIETESKLTADDCRALLATSPGIEVVDYPEKQAYPMALDATGLDEVFVGRIREDHTVENGLNLWVVSDNIRKGAALNAVQIAETLLEMDLMRVER
ncbi:aspartate semialdehyde dehydrogenase [Paucidesulfovibrio gracilis DSM 16080]|uniref:Aspartate-semialdehyde dehydrogenase n=1 Tax=Paucidesulfovibrio gracilis DSM 16080 TaxID=1121449 RepID=A0A1T4WJD9_9BACT|nr:aspartate-semialdehyde dehydrogenase [Paucidesulfovibrio gracilis]SKA76751.1 aspartate semialdehyde dehydrogenase [Paucidesulfovibrio gracilis DSM 16080]